MFNRARIPCNSKPLRQALFKGPILGELLRMATAELASNTKQEIRYSMKVKSDEGLKELAEFWMKEHLRSEQVRPIIQVAKLQLEGHVSSFGPKLETRV